MWYVALRCLHSGIGRRRNRVNQLIDTGDGFEIWDDNRTGFELYATRTLHYEILSRRREVLCIVYIPLIQQ
jgi:hypothetical protein